MAFAKKSSSKPATKPAGKSDKPHKAEKAAKPAHSAKAAPHKPAAHASAKAATKAAAPKPAKPAPKGKYAPAPAAPVHAAHGLSAAAHAEAAGKAAQKVTSKLASSLKSAIMNIAGSGRGGAKEIAAAKAAKAAAAKAEKVNAAKAAAGYVAPQPALTVKARGKGKGGKSASQEPGHRMAGPSIRVAYDSNGEAVCREVACENLGTSGGYCRMHYIKNWKKIKRKDGILREGKLNQYIEELVAKYPDKYIEAIRQDLANDKDFAKVIYDLDLDESTDDFEGEGESMEGVIDNIKRDFDDDSDTGF